MCVMLKVKFMCVMLKFTWIASFICMCVMLKVEFNLCYETVVYLWNELVEELKIMREVYVMNACERFFWNDVINTSYGCMSIIYTPLHLSSSKQEWRREISTKELSYSSISTLSLVDCELWLLSS